MTFILYDEFLIFILTKIQRNRCQSITYRTVNALNLFLVANEGELRHSFKDPYVVVLVD